MEKEEMDESKKLSIEEVARLKKRIELLRKVALFALLPVLGYALLLVFTPLRGIESSWPFFLFMGSFLAWYASHALKFVKQWENAPVFRFGKLMRILKPGLGFMAYPFEKVIFVEMWEREVDLPEQSVNSKEGNIFMDIRLYFKTTDAGRFLTAVKDPVGMVTGKAKGSITTSVGPMTIDELLTKRMELADTIETSLDKDVLSWGMDITQIRFDNIRVPKDVLKAREKLAETKMNAESIKVEADAQKYRVQAAADAEKYKLTAEAEGKAKEFELKVKALGDDGAKIMGLVLTSAEWAKGEGKFFIDPKTVGIPAIAELLKDLKGGK
ncbi:MAG TPA: SPFH domain-containing protein [Candidatus Paceibacterota bacterium]|nr:SPFH domain-containing protein [Candidatus Paceibacterota bacterium]